MKAATAQQALQELCYEHKLAAKLNELRYNTHYDTITMSQVHDMILDDIRSLYELAESIRIATEAAPF